MKETSNLKLSKPDLNDTVDIGIINANMDILDTELTKKADKAEVEEIKENLITDIGTELENVKTTLDTELIKKADKTYVDTELTGLKQSVVSGKTQIATAINGKDNSIVASGSDSFLDLAGKIKSIDLNPYNYKTYTTVAYEFNGNEDHDYNECLATIICTKKPVAAQLLDYGGQHNKDGGLRCWRKSFFFLKKVKSINYPLMDENFKKIGEFCIEPYVWNLPGATGSFVEGVTSLVLNKNGIDIDIICSSSATYVNYVKAIIYY